MTDKVLESKRNDLPLGILEIIYNKILIDMTGVIRGLEVSYNRETAQAMIVYPISIGLWWLLFNRLGVFTTFISKILSSDITVISLSLLASIITIESIKNDGSLFHVYASGKKSFIRNVANLEHDIHESSNPKIKEDIIKEDIIKEDINEKLLTSTSLDTSE